LPPTVYAKVGLVTGDNQTLSLANLSVQYILEPYTLGIKKRKTSKGFRDDMVRLCFGSQTKKGINTLDSRLHSNHQDRSSRWDRPT